MTSALLVRDLTVSLQSRVLVDGVTFAIFGGERVALLGASGSGKSLTASVLLGQLPAGMRVQGSMMVSGRDAPLNGQRRAGAGEVAAVYQDPATALNPMVCLGRQLTIPLRKAGLSASAAQDRAAQLLISVGITDPARVLAGFSGELSGGQLQRVCIALALACRSAVLIADEPTTALDVISQAKVLEALMQASGTHNALLFITHDLAVAAALCTRAMVMHSGRIVEQGPMDRLLARPEHSYTQQLVEAAHASAGAFALKAGA